MTLRLHQGLALGHVTHRPAIASAFELHDILPVLVGLRRSVRRGARRGNPIKAKRKGPQLALEPLDGRGIAGYVPEPKSWARSRGLFRGTRLREEISSCRRARRGR